MTPKLLNGSLYCRHPLDEIYLRQRIYGKNHLVTTGTVLKCVGKGGRGEHDRPRGSVTLQKSALFPFHWECFPLKTQEVILTSTNQPTADSKDGGGREADAAQDTEGTRKPSKMN